jgi:hypothetical protein
LIGISLWEDPNLEKGYQYVTDSRAERETGASKKTDPSGPERLMQVRSFSSLYSKQPSEKRLPVPCFAGLLSTFFVGANNPVRAFH